MTGEEVTNVKAERSSASSDNAFSLAGVWTRSLSPAPINVSWFICTSLSRGHVYGSQNSAVDCVTLLYLRAGPVALRLSLHHTSLRCR